MLLVIHCFRPAEREDILRTVHEISDVAERRKYVRGAAADPSDPAESGRPDTDLASGDDGIVEVENWIGCGSNGCRIAKLVVAVGARNDSGKPGAAPAGTTRALARPGARFGAPPQSGRRCRCRPSWSCNSECRSASRPAVCANRDILEAARRPRCATSHLACRSR